MMMRKALLTLALLVTVLGGCAGRQPPTDNGLNQSVDDVISRLGTSLPGQYSNFSQHRQDNDIPLLQLDISRRDVPGQFLVAQRASDSAVPLREFIWQFTRTPKAELQLEFAPLINGNTGPSCRLILRPARAGISGSTEQQKCRLPNRDNQPIGLLKEFLLNPETIELGERLYNLDTGNVLANDTRLEFHRQLNYQGWAGRQDKDSGEWLLAQPFALHNQGDSVELFDNADRSLGYRVELARIIYRSDQPEVLRLAVIDNDSGKQVAYAWASTTAARIGINLGWLQIGMQRSELN